MNRHFSAAAYFSPETGIGFALANEEGEFFCGYRQNNGALASAYFVQMPRPGQTPAFKRTAWAEKRIQGEPVFLNPQDMKEQGAAAVVFPFIDQAGKNTVAKLPGTYYKSYTVAKDLTHEPGKAYKSLWPDTPGLASPGSCENGIDRGYVSVGMAVKKFVSKLFSR